MDVARLLREHLKLRSLGTELVVLVSGPEPCDFDQLSRCRWNLARLVHLHLAYEERYLFFPLETDPRLDVRAAGAKAKRGVEHLHIIYTAHVERWTVDAVMNRWPEFQTAVKAMVAQMIVKIDREEADLFPLVAQDDAVPRCWQPGMRNWAGDGVALQPMIKAAAPLAQPQPHAMIDERAPVLR